MLKERFINRRKDGGHKYSRPNGGFLGPSFGLYPDDVDLPAYGQTSRTNTVAVRQLSLARSRVLELQARRKRRTPDPAQSK